MEQPNYYAVIPANVRYDKKLKPMAKLLYGEISALSQKDGTCWATNGYFAELYDLDNLTISRLISQLEKRGYITVTLVYKEGTKEIEKRVICIDEKNNTSIQNNQEGTDEEINTPIDEEINTPIDEKVKENNTSSEQNKNEQYKNNKKEKVSKDTSKKEDEFTDIYSRECFNLPQIRVLTDTRKKSIKTFLTKYALSDWEEVCKIANASDFLCGKNDRGWKADFDFLINVNKATRVLEGKYSGKPREGPEEGTSNPFFRVLKEMEEDDQKGSSADTSDNENDVSTILSDYTIE